MTLENLLVVLAILAFAFVNVILPWLRKRREGDEGHASGQRDEIEPEVPEVLAPTPMPSPLLDPLLTLRREEPTRPPRLGAMALPAIRPPVRWQFGNLQDVRRGIVLMTILGPCRALDKSDSSSN